MALMKCKECGGDVSNKAKFCPACGAIPSKKTSRLTWLVLILIILFVYGVSQAPAVKPIDKKIEVINASKEKQQELDPAKCQYLSENSPVNLYINESWISDKWGCITLERKEKIERELYSFAKKIPATQVSNNQKYYKLLAIISPDNLLYKKKFAQYDAELTKENEEFEIKQAKIMKNNEREQAKTAREQAAVTHRKERVGEQFSAWDGSHRNLERLIKRNMNDPDSYEHDNTVYWDKGSYLIIETTYRGKNAFGGIVLNSVKAKVAIDGQVLEILN